MKTNLKMGLVKLLNSEPPFARSRKIMKKTFNDDPDFERVYIDNIAMFLYDRFGGIFNNIKTRNDAAQGLMNLIFRS